MRRRETESPIRPEIVVADVVTAVAVLGFLVWGAKGGGFFV